MPSYELGFPAPSVETQMRSPIDLSISVPFRFDFDGRVATVEGRRNIVRQEMLTQILTFLGERVMMPTYGSNLGQYLWQAYDDDIIGVLLDELQDLIQSNFSGVGIINLSTDKAKSSEEGELVIQLDYTMDGMPDRIVVNTNSVLMEN